jgi:MoaA/NifB/PqqE/SkfB family radical SAM enzyme
MMSIDIAALTAELPGIAWVELTSKCPFDCVFCTRK